MARPKKTDAPDTTQAIDLTAGTIERLTCRTDTKAQAFLRDTKAPGLRVRVTNTGAKAFVFEGKLNRQTIRRTIGDVRTWSIEQARTEARRLAVLLDNGQDPREIERQQQADKAAAQAAASAQALTVGELWPLYLAQGRPKRKDAWKPRYRADLESMASPGGAPKKRGQGLTLPGPLHPLMGLALVDVTPDALATWYDREALRGKDQAARARGMFQGFLRWCSGQPEYRALADREAPKDPRIVENLPPTKRRTGALEAAQVPGWWQGVEELGNRTASAYLKTLLLTGARREEVAAIQWQDVDFQWRKLTLADKATSTRTIPLTPYLAQLLATLPRVGPYVFAADSKTGHIADARDAHAKALQSAGVPHLTFHDLRRTFIQHARRVVPAGVPAQISGHAPSAVAEGYAVLSIGELRPYAEQVEAHILGLAGVQFTSASQPGTLRLVAGGTGAAP